MLFALFLACADEDASEEAPPGALPSGPFATFDAGVTVGAGTGPELASDPCHAGRCAQDAPSSDGCTETPVVGLSLNEIAVYQAVKVPIMRDQTAVSRAQRDADVVQGRDAVFRVHVTPAPGFTPRQVSARLTLHSADAGGQSRQFFAKLTPGAASRDDEPASAFLIKVPGDALQTDTRYALSLVECGQGPAGAAHGARFPGDGFTPLEARATGPLRVHLVPLDFGMGAPDVSAEALAMYERRIMAAYPITKLELTVGAPLRSTATSMCAHLSAIRARRAADDAPVDVYYYGLSNGLSGGQSGCSSAPSSASSSGKTAVGWQTIGDPDRGERGASTMAHELGHAHGRLHAPCGIQDPDPNYPYPNADTGVWGYDARSGAFLPPTRKDMMSYCPNPDRAQAWLSDYTYKALMERVAAVNALADQRMFVQDAQQTTWRQLVVDSAGRQWGGYPLVLTVTPEGSARSAYVQRRDGTRLAITVYQEALEDGISEEAYLLTVPAPRPDWRTLEVPGLLAPEPF